MNNDLSTLEAPLHTPIEGPSPIQSYTPSPVPPDRASFEARYPYGWRDIHVAGPDGEERPERVPLTLNDVMHPEVGDVHLNNTVHQVFCHYLYSVFQAQVETDPSAVVFQDTGIEWDIPGLERHSPDVTVILGVRERRRWDLFYVEEEGVRPVLVVEVTSPNTRSIDVVDKLKEYAVAGIPQYVIVDTGTKRGTTAVSLLGYHLSPEGYVRVDADERGWLWLEPVRLWIGLEGGQVHCYDKDGKGLGTYSEISAALARESEARAAAEARALADAQARVAAEAQALAESEARAAAEARAAEAEDRLREIETELRGIQGSF